MSNSIITHDLSYHLLMVFYTLYYTKSVTETANKLFVTQSTVSNNLRKLRDIFDDQLFYKNNNRMIATAKAENLIVKVTDILRLYQKLLPKKYSLKQSTHSFNLCITPLLQDLCYTKIIQKLHNTPYKLEVYNLHDEQMLKEVANSTNMDFILSSTDLSLPQYHKEILYTEDFIVIMNKKNPLAGQKFVTMKDYLQAMHLVNSFSSKKSFLANVLDKKNMERQIFLETDNIISIYTALQKFNFVLATLTPTFLKVYENIFDLSDMYICPLQLNEKAHHTLYFLNEKMLIADYANIKQIITSTIYESTVS
ncbi:LysR family transcriptional regulator [Facilibium subflavum]|uniref:LysR family transcriptional regulator n=1 Tax=Facilibium subflavum TaxID=2219058 RepID=UPI000E6589EE|nr:LysR family transcriptional regulator [Facilibium subflavum]